MAKDKVKMALMLSIVFFIWGGYLTGKTAYSALMWEKTQGFVTDFQLHNFSCGRRSQCYSLVVGYRVGKEHFYTNSKKKFDDRPLELNGQSVPVYYQPADPQNAVLGGAYSPAKFGSVMLLLSFVLFVVYFFSRER